MNKLVLVIRYPEPEFPPSKSSEPARLLPALTLLLLSHLLLELVTLFSKELALFLKELFEVLLRFLCIEWLSLLSAAPSLLAPLLLLLLTSAPLKGPLIGTTATVHVPHGVVLGPLLLV